MDIQIYGEIMDTQGIIEELKTTPDDVTLTINSPGGSVIDGLQVVNAIKGCPRNVTAKIEVMAASMAGVIALACDRVQIDKNSLMMLHNCWTTTQGNRRQLESEIEAMKAIDSILQGIIAEHSGDASIIERMNAGDVWLTGEEVAAMFNHVALVEQERPYTKAAETYLAEMLKENRAYKAKEKDPEEEKIEEDPPETEDNPEEESGPNKEKPDKEQPDKEEPDEERKKAYTVSDELRALMDKAGRICHA